MAGVQQGGPRFGASRPLPALVFSTVYLIFTPCPFMSVRIFCSILCFSVHLFFPVSLTCLCFLLSVQLLFTLSLSELHNSPRHLASCCQLQQRGGGGSVVGETEAIRIFRIWERRRSCKEISGESGIWGPP